jgi:hypothetical protein
MNITKFRYRSKRKACGQKRPTEIIQKGTGATQKRKGPEASGCNGFQGPFLYCIGGLGSLQEHILTDTKFYPDCRKRLIPSFWHSAFKVSDPQRATEAVFPFVSRSRSEGESSTCVPIFPPLTRIVSKERQLSWNIVGKSFFMPIGEHPPRI